MYNIREMQSVQLDIFKQVYKVCVENNIPIFLAYGTAIGAVRHKGFIPWDDDIDIFVLQEDRKRFQEACIKGLPSNYFYQSVDTDANYRLAIDRIRNSNTTLVEADVSESNINHGIFIDVYPLFKCAEKKTDYFKQRGSRFLYRLFLYNEAPKNKSPLVKIIASLILKLTPSFVKKQVLCKSSEYVQKKGATKYLSVFYGDDESVKYASKWFSASTLVPFEDMEAPLPCGYEKILELQYGDYMELPPEEKRVVHHDYVCVDCHASYIDRGF